MTPDLEELRFANGTIEAVVLPGAGARIHRLRVFGHDLLQTPPSTGDHLRDPFFWGAYVMAPWCNRIDAAAIDIGGRRLALVSNFADGSAIHGQVYARPWQRRPDGTLAITGGGAGDGWPWEYEVSLDIEVVDRAVRLDLRLANRSSDPMPAGLGIHPWFRRPVAVAIHGDAVYAVNAATEPHPEPVHGAFDRRALGPMAPGLDATWTDLADPAVELAWPDLGIRATMRIAGPSAAVIVAASPTDLEADAVEPETHAPQGLRRLINGEPDGMVLLDPGRTLHLGVELTFARLEDAAG